MFKASVRTTATPAAVLRAVYRPTGAILREKQWKGWTRAKKIALIEKANPAWVDLSEAWESPVDSYRWPQKELAGRTDQCSPEKKAGPSATLRSAQDDGL
ncbi:MAG: hypothetical protein ACRYF4_12150 [Janthinobacterium lividum]